MDFIMNNFSIVLPETLDVYPGYDISSIDCTEISALMCAEYKFQEMYFGNPWFIHLGETKFDFHTEDICFIWEDLPELFKQLADPNWEVSMLSLMEQGTDTLIVIE